ncbi:MAG: HlyD family efflux transporter periplasmic adaptor subunit [Acidobacteria bacterium]|nr:HlyD family efflux transporter periplasmic adaptor subunit [Acidobacteriota bacterium]
MLIIASLAAAIVGVWRLTHQAPKPAGQAALRLATVERRPLIRTLRVNGKVAAQESVLVSAPTLQGQPLGVLVVTRMAKSGSHVRKDDVLVEFDRQDQLKNAADREAEFHQKEDDIKRAQANEDAARAKDDTELKQGDDAVHSAEWELRRNEVISKIDAEKNQETLDAARATLVQLKATYQLKRQSAAAGIRALEIERDRSRAAMEHARQNAEKLQVLSPMAGIVVPMTIWKNGSMGEVEEGDEVRSGTPFAQVISPGSMEIRARINQADLALLQPGMGATIRLDAFPDLALPGRLEYLSAVANTSNFSNWVRTFSAVFSVQGKDANLMPDLSAAVDIELARLADALVVPRDAVVTSAGQQYAWVKRGDSFQRVAVKTGAVTDVELEVTSGLEPGQTVLRNPANTIAATAGPPGAAAASAANEAAQ